ncbi:nitrate reductase molybdenum cofactor assembly chaperone [Bhargavaea ullalensis]|uniref:Nitrate reductase delta subunit n=1 Tax=Bhargavaea ullalensis TaxID=1265685 RepID=A0ABV2G7W8_9BACL
MIDHRKLYTYKESFGFFADQLIWPENQDFSRETIEAVFGADHPARHHVLEFGALMEPFDGDEIQEMYTATFDFEKDCALYMTWFKFEDARERGQMLAKLKVLYEMYGLEMPDEELSDYLPIILEFLYAAEWLGDPRTPDSFRILMAVLEDGTYHLVKALEKEESPYFHLVKGLRETFKACIEQEAPAHEHG